jgi:hypothetical protein
MAKNNIETEKGDNNGLWEEIVHSGSVVKNLVQSLLQAEKKLLKAEIGEKKGKVVCESLEARVIWIDQFCNDFLSC